MSLSSDLVSQFVKVTLGNNKYTSESTAYGTIVVHDGKNYVKLDGSDLLTPIDTTTDVVDGERVTVLIKNHTATVTGNMSSPAARTDDVKEVDKKVDEIGNQISEFEIVIADKVDTKQLAAESARIDELRADNVTIKNTLTAYEADITKLKAEDVTISGKLDANEAEIETLKTTKLDASVADLTYATIDNLDATNANIHNLNADYGEFQSLSTKKFETYDATINNLDTTYANIDFANIGEAAIRKLFADYGLIADLVVSDGKITGELVGVKIKGDLIEANTLIADKLVIQGEDGLYYRLNTDGEVVESEQTEYNSLDGRVIVAKSVTANKIAVDDLVAFDATIGGFVITDDSIHSVEKSTIDNPSRGVYMDNMGQVVFGDTDSYIKYYKDSDNTYKLAISAGSITLQSIGKTIDDALSDQNEVITSLEQNVNGFKTEVSSTYATKTALEETNTEVANVKDSADAAGEVANGLVEDMESILGDGTEENVGLITTLQTKIEQTDEAWSLAVQQTNEVVSATNDKIGEVDGKVSEYSTWFTMDEDGLTISKTENGAEHRLKVVIDNDSMDFYDGDNKVAYVSNEKLMIRSAEIEGALDVGGFRWKKRDNGNMGLMWIGG